MYLVTRNCVLCGAQFRHEVKDGRQPRKCERHNVGHNKVNGVKYKPVGGITLTVVTIDELIAEGE